MSTPPNTFPRALIGWINILLWEKNTQLNKSMIKLLNFAAEDNCCQQSQNKSHQLKPKLTKKKKGKGKKAKNKSQEKTTNPRRPIQFLFKCLSMMGIPPNTFPTSLIGWIFWRYIYTAEQVYGKTSRFSGRRKIAVNNHNTKPKHNQKKSQDKITSPHRSIQYLFKCLHFVCPSVHQRWHSSPTPSQEAW